MDFEIRDLLCDINIIKEKIDDVVTAHAWFVDGHFKYSSHHTLTKEQILKHGYNYKEQSIHNTQLLDLLGLYLNEFDELINKFQELEKASLTGDQTESDA